MKSGKFYLKNVFLGVLVKTCLVVSAGKNLLGCECCITCLVVSAGKTCLAVSAGNST